MPRGRKAWILGGGGAAEGLPQAVQIKEFWDAGERPDDIVLISVGAFNGWNPADAIKIWEKEFRSPWDICDFNPEIKIIIEQVFQNIPRSPFHRHATYKELFSDFKDQYSKLVQIIHFLMRAGRSIPTLSIGQPPSPEDFTPFLKIFIEEANKHQLNCVRSIFDPAPLVKKLRKTIDLKKALESGITLHIFTQSTAGDAIFIAGSMPDADTLNRLQDSVQIHSINSEEELFRASLASAALRPLFAPVRMNGGQYWDVGAINPFPADYAFDIGCDEVFAFVKNFWSHKPNPDLDFYGASIDESDTSTQRHFIRQYKDARRRATAEGRKLHMILPQSLHADLDLLWISPEAIEHTKKVETEATRKWIKENLPAGRQV